MHMSVSVSLVWVLGIHQGRRNCVVSQAWQETLA